MKQKYIATIGALALTVPALAMAQTADQQRQDRSAQPGQQQTQQQPGASQHTPGTTMQQERAQQERGAQQQQRTPGQSEYGQKQAGLAGHKQGAFKVDNLTGQEIKNAQGEDIGTIEDVLIDRDGRVAAVLVSTGGVMGIGGETKAVEWNRIEVQLNQDQTDIDRVTTTMSEQELDNLPEFDENRRGATGQR
jgi:sporulation protein YlmC with PRC-barrel domain